MVEIGFDGHQTLILYQSAKSVPDKILIRPASHQIALASQLGPLNIILREKSAKATKRWDGTAHVTGPVHSRVEDPVSCRKGAGLPL